MSRPARQLKEFQRQQLMKKIVRKGTEGPLNATAKEGVEKNDRERVNTAKDERSATVDLASKA